MLEGIDIRNSVFVRVAAKSYYNYSTLLKLK